MLKSKEIKRTNSSNDSHYDNFTIFIKPGIVSQIYSMLATTFMDFYGFFIGQSKLIKQSNKSDNEIIEKVELYLSIENVIFVYQRSYFNEKLEKLLDKITKKSMILGIFSARNNSYPNISLREQEFYFKVKNYVKNICTPLIYGCFCHRQNLEELITIDFKSKLYMINENK